MFSDAVETVVIREVMRPSVENDSGSLTKGMKINVCLCEIVVVNV